MPRSYLDRLEAGIGFHWRELPPRMFSAADVDPAAELVVLHRERSSHRGIGRRSAIRTLFAYSVDQDFVGEIGALRDLETLYLERVTATDLIALTRLPALRGLVINSATRIDSLDWAAHLSPNLCTFAIEHAPRVRDLGSLAALSQLETLGVEGNLHASMRVRSLDPLRGLMA